MKLPYRWIRNLHLLSAPLIGAFVYSSALRELDAFVTLVQWAVFLLVAGAGLVLWLAPRLARLRSGLG